MKKSGHPKGAHMIQVSDHARAILLHLEHDDMQFHELLKSLSKMTIQSDVAFALKMLMRTHLIKKIQVEGAETTSITYCITKQGRQYLAYDNRRNVRSGHS
jgi:DNA-binding HxlR family transcriptional regulator